MTIRFQVEPRDVPPEKAARRLGLSEERFVELLPRLLSRGFPASDPDTGNYDLDAVDAWRAARHRRLLPGSSIPAHTPGLVASRLEKMGG
ncbi:hypothetical protein LB519_14910 [Mesorhizobium sp. AD1-1]|uniref:hypothetical protein n=1 Tax=Mesorhizobium sp. AD1-1 TaxID=2876621 RepID=UPI001CCB441A|nr:hypothetical protein [Mesorhizobium sp. AD1-1]MBZ9719137.1 hypothetical protein [Mesorhizobium sp. AD1-1]